MGSGKHIRRAIQKHGSEAFSKEILFVFDSEEAMNAKEAELVTEEFCLREDTFNICPGGKGGWGYVNSQDLTDRNTKISRTRRMTTKLDAAIKDNLAKGRSSGTGKWPSWVGKRHTEESKLKMSLVQLGKQAGEKNSQYGSFWATNGSVAKKFPKDTPLPEGWSLGRKKTG
jgi:hypothetical protein